MATFSDVVSEFASAFCSDTRNDGMSFVKFRDDAPDWLQGSDVMLSIHQSLDDRMPDDWVYATARAIVDSLDDRELGSADDARDYLPEITDGLVDVYNSDRLRWLASHLNNALLVDQAREEGLIADDSDTFTQIGIGQYLAIERIGFAVIDQCESEFDDRAVSLDHSCE